VLGPYCFGRFEVRPIERQFLVDGNAVGPGARAFDLLLALIERRERVVGKNELLDLVWPGLVVEDNNLQVQISALRKLLGAQSIATIPGRGYQFTVVLDAETARELHASAEQTNLNNLPQQRTRFIGRETALADCAQLLSDARLLTLTGIGGCGKTRLALQLAQQQLAEYPGGVWFVDLAPLQDAQRVAGAVATTLGVREDADTPLTERLASELAQRRVLLVLDNCEHVIDAVAVLIESLLTSCNQLRIIATSREPLGVAGEQIYPVRPLSLPATSELDAIQGSEAVRVFVDRARLALPDFVVDERNASSIAEICRRLDGIALAIELAAARVTMLSVDEIRVRLDDRFRLLIGSSRALPRHQTLQAMMQWSYDQLSPLERHLFRQLSVFVGGWTLAAAARVAGDTADEHEVLERLTHLHEKSLLIVDRDNNAQPRYRMLETVRQYALDRLHESGQGDAVRTQHLLHYLALADEAAAHLMGPEQGVWIVRLLQEQENLLAAHAWCQHAPGGAERGLRLVDSLSVYWASSAQTERGYRLGQDALEFAGDRADASSRCYALKAVGWHAHRNGHYDETLAYANQSLALARELDKTQQIGGLNLLGTGLLATGQAAAARLCWEEACELARTLNDDWRLSVMLNNLAEMHRSAANSVAAEACYAEAIDIARARGDALLTAKALGNLARLLIGAGQAERARTMLLESLAIAQRAGLKDRGVHLLEASAGLVATLGDHASAARLHGAALARMKDAGYRREPVDETFIAPLMARSREVLGTRTFDLAESAGASLSYEASMVEMRQRLEHPHDGSKST